VWQVDTGISCSLHSYSSWSGTPEKDSFHLKIHHPNVSSPF